MTCSLFRWSYEILWQISSARAECVSAPMEIASTPHAPHTLPRLLPKYRRSLRSACGPTNFRGGAYRESRRFLRRHVVEHQQARIFLALPLPASGEKSRAAARAAASPRTSTSMNADVRATLPRPLDGHRRRIFFAARDQREMIVLDHDRVAQTRGGAFRRCPNAARACRAVPREFFACPRCAL